MKRKALLFFSGSLVALLTGSLAAILPARRAIGGATLAVGANAHVLWPTYTDTDRTNVLNRVAEAGLRMLRVDLDWDWVEYEGRGMRDTGPGSAYASLSGFVDQARARGISILIVVKGTPGWANGGQGPRVPPTDARDYGNFMGWLAGQLHGRAAAYELWNEPNSASFFTGTAAQYVALVKAAGPAIKGADPQASVVVGATQPYLALTFLTAAYDAGLASATFDAVSHHPYADPSDAPPEQDSPNPDVISLPGVARLHALMDRYGDSRPIWLTEWGYSSHTNSGTEPPWSRGVTLAQQADYLSRAVSYTRQYLPYVAVSLWYNERDTNTDNVQEDNYGLMDAAYNPRPAYWAAAQAATSSPPPQPSPSPVPSTTPSPTPSPSPSPIPSATPTRPSPLPSPSPSPLPSSLPIAVSPTPITAAPWLLPISPTPALSGTILTCSHGHRGLVCG